MFNQFFFRMAMLLPILFTVLTAQSYTVTKIAAVCKDGQVFLTWKNPSATNLKYKVYRSTEKFKNSSKLSESNYLGYVKDNSGKNVRKSLLKDQDYYFTIDHASGPLNSTTGLYVITSSDSKKYFYAVTVVNLTKDTEDKTIILGSNSMSEYTKEQKSTPQPILQKTVTQSNGDINYEYTIWGNNQDVAGYPAFNNCGSYGYDFTLVERYPGASAPLYIKFDDDDPFKKMGKDECSNCNMLQLDDWLPNGENSYWVGYNTNYDIYSDDNPEQTSGIVRTYTQNRLRQIFSWAALQPHVDSTRFYSNGFSHNGFGALLTCAIMPEKIAATQMTCSPSLIKAENGSDRETQWSQSNLKLKSDVVDESTGDTIPIWELLDLRKTFRRNINKSLPFMSGINGKQDVTVGWVQNFHWFDSLDFNRQGGVWFWDQRNHTGEGKDFNTDETKLDFLRFSTKKSFPAFAYCSINEDPGNGNVNDGDPYGSLNGYLDWDDLSISDKKCTYSIYCFIKDFYVGGVKQKKYDSCVRDVSLKRLQKFKPANGQVITWTVKNNSNAITQTGSFTYSSDKPITIYGAKIYRAGSTLSFSIDNCSKEEIVSEQQPFHKMKLAKTHTGYDVIMNLSSAMNIEINIFDMIGRRVNFRNMAMHEGENKFSLSLPSGAYIIHANGSDFSESDKLLF